MIGWLGRESKAPQPPKGEFVIYILSLWVKGQILSKRFPLGGLGGFMCYIHHILSIPIEGDAIAESFVESVLP